MTAEHHDTSPLRVLHVDDARLRRRAATLDRLAGDLATVAEPREPDVGQRRQYDGRLAIPICLPARELSRQLGELAAALVAVSDRAGAADADAATLSRLLLGEVR